MRGGPAVTEKVTAAVEWFRGKSATRPLAKCPKCCEGHCEQCARVYRRRAQAPATRCRCACRAL